MENTLFDNNEISNIQGSTVEKKFERYILQVHRIKLQDYVQCGLITPDDYLGDEIEKDIQSNNPHFLVFSEGYLEELDKEQVLLEIIFSEDEKNELLHIEDVCYCHYPLPITRIKKVYAQDKVIIKHILINLETSEKGFLPDNLFDSYTNNKKLIFEQKQFRPLPEDIKIVDFKQQIIKFDKRMGMFGFIKNSKIYYVNETGHIGNYSDNYFAILSNMLDNKLDSKVFDGLSVIKENEAFNGLLYSDKQIDEEFIRSTALNITDQDTKELFLKILEQNSTRKTLPVLFEKQAYLYYYIALIYYFRQKDSNRKDNFKSDIKNIIPESIAEVALAILGIYLGYKILRAQETVDIQDKVFKKIFGNSWNVKFKLNSKLDYVTIETIYNYSFNDIKKSGDFDYLIYPKRVKPLTLPADKEFLTWYMLEENEYLNVQYIRIRKKTFEQIVDEKLKNYNEDIVLGKDYLLSFVAKYFKNLLYYSKDEQPIEPYCKNEELRATFKNEQNGLNKNELLSIFELDKK